MCVTIRLWVLFPDEWVGRNGVQGREIISAQRPEGEEGSRQSGLEIKGHAGRISYAATRMIHVTKVRDLTLQAPSSPERHPHLSAASGLVVAGTFLYVVADDELQLGVFPAIGDAPGKLIPLLPGHLPAKRKARKARKADLEVLTQLPPYSGAPFGALLALGSGSKRKRRIGALLPLDGSGAIAGSPRPIDFSGLFDSLEPEFPKLNIEGAVVVEDRLRLLQRGTKRHRQSAWIDLSLPEILRAVGASDVVDHATLLGTTFFDLGAIDGIPLAFTDGAALPDGSIMFAAVAEDAENSYEDGPCVGAAIGRAGSDGRLRFLERLDPTYKVEGVDARIEGDMITLLLVTDADDEHLPASLLTAAISTRPPRPEGAAFDSGFPPSRG